MSSSPTTATTSAPPTTAAPTVRELLYKGKTRELPKAIYDGSHYYGTQSFHQSISQLYKTNLISYEDALAGSDNPDELKLELRGVTKGLATKNFEFVPPESA